MKRYLAEFFGWFWAVAAAPRSMLLSFRAALATTPGRCAGFWPDHSHYGPTRWTYLRRALQPRRLFGALGWRPAFSPQLPSYIIAWVTGGLLAALILYIVASGQADFDVSRGFASNGFGETSPGGYSMLAALVCELLMTAIFLFAIMGATDSKAPQGFGPLAWPWPWLISSASR